PAIQATEGPREAVGSAGEEDGEEAAFVDIGAGRKAWIVTKAIPAPRGPERWKSDNHMREPVESRA
ncbi:hypothetical protein, partial [Variovorax paradoxus]|uniref:hypothetical protein n=1 Tax=Variovorax paradoxus TaxID=34073 RepID=UPI001ABD1384